MAINTDPTNGESPLTDNPYAKLGGTSNENEAGLEAFLGFSKQFGRNPTQSELTQLTPSYLTGKPASSGHGTSSVYGDAAVASYYNSFANNPATQGLDAYAKNQSTIDPQVSQLFQQSLGRAPTADEASHFGALIASKQIDPYGLTQLLGQSQEAQQIQTQKYSDTLSKNLQGTQADYFKNQILPSIQSNFAKQGRSFDSSGFQNSVVQAGKQQNYDLQNYLAQFGANQYSQSANTQQGVYATYLNSLNANQGQGINQALAQLTAKNSQLADYGIMQNSYDNYLSKYGKRQTGAQGAIGGATAGAATGAYFGPYGAAIGAVGGGLAGYFGSQS